MNVSRRTNRWLPRNHRHKNLFPTELPCRPWSTYWRARAFAQNNMAIRHISDAAVKEAAASIHQPRDPNTLSNYNAWRTKHTTANLVIDFARRRLKGNVELTLERLSDEKKIVLDTRYDSRYFQVDSG